MAGTLNIEVDVSEVEISLEFANTADWHASEKPVESLVEYDDLVKWALEKELATEAEARQLRDSARRDPAAATRVIGRAIQLREVIYRILSAYAGASAIDEADLALLNERLQEAMAKVRVTPNAEGYVMGWIDDLNMEMMLWPVARSAARLLTSERLLERVGQCQDDRGCGLLYLDMSKNRSRRWCDIKDCGNRAKQRRYYQRQRRGGD